MNVQDPIVVGNTFGRVRAMTNDLGRRVKVAGPSTPVSITGLNEAPMAGDHFAVYEDEKSARAAGEERAKRALMKQRQATQRVSLENLFDTLKAGELKSVNVIIKADVQGSVEALSASLQKIDVEGVKVTIVHSALCHQRVRRNPCRSIKCLYHWFQRPPYTTSSSTSGC